MKQQDIKQATDKLIKTKKNILAEHALHDDNLSKYILAIVGWFSALFWLPRNRAAKLSTRHEAKKRRRKKSKEANL